MADIRLTQEELRLAVDAARRAAWKWPGVEAADVQAYLWTWLCEHYKVVLRYRDEAFGVSKLAAALKHEAWAYCRKEAAAMQSAPLGAQNDYDRALVERALPYIWDYSDWHQSTPDGHVAASVETDLALTILADVSAAYYSLSPGDQDLLAWRHRDNLTLRKIAGLLGPTTTEEAARKRYSKTMKRLLERLSGTSASWDPVSSG